MKKDLVKIKEEYFIKFKKLYLEEFGEEEYNKMTEEQLFISATALINLVEVIYKPMLKEDHKKLTQNEKREAKKID